MFVSSASTGQVIALGEDLLRLTRSRLRSRRLHQLMDIAARGKCKPYGVRAKRVKAARKFAEDIEAWTPVTLKERSKLLSGWALTR